MARDQLQGDSELELILLNRCERAGLPAPVLGHQFALPERKWKFDACWPAAKVAVEVEGGAYVGGRHVRGRGYEQDCLKYNAAVLRGWLLLRFTRRHIVQGLAVEQIRQALEASGRGNV